jgi:hypothetical protein
MYKGLIPFLRSRPYDYYTKRYSKQEYMVQVTYDSRYDQLPQKIEIWAGIEFRELSPPAEHRKAVYLFENRPISLNLNFKNLSRGRSAYQVDCIDVVRNIEVTMTVADYIEIANKGLIKKDGCITHTNFCFAKKGSNYFCKAIYE